MRQAARRRSRWKSRNVATCRLYPVPKTVVATAKSSPEACKEKSSREERKKEKEKKEKKMKIFTSVCVDGAKEKNEKPKMNKK